VACQFIGNTKVVYLKRLEDHKICLLVLIKLVNDVRCTGSQAGGLETNREKKVLRQDKLCEILLKAN
jgi:hypothetical protein